MLNTQQNRAQALSPWNQGEMSKTEGVNHATGKNP